MTKPIELTVEYINTHIGETINWECFGYHANLPYKGSCKLLGIEYDERRKRNRPLVEHISGDELKYGWADLGGTIVYTDSDRTVLIQDTFNIYTAVYNAGISEPVHYSFVVRKGADPYQIARQHIRAETFTLEIAK